MTPTFRYTANPARVVFGAGTAAQVGEEVTRLGVSRALLLRGRGRAAAAQPVRDALGALLAAEFDGAAMHTPVEVTEGALNVLREHDADGLVAIGGGSTTGLAKALAARTGLPQLILPTTYAGSEVTPVLGETKDGQKTTWSSPAILPETVVYDVQLTLGLPVAMSVCSAVNALAHAVEALYSAQANPVTDGMALSAISGIAAALPGIVAEPAGLDARPACFKRPGWPARASAPSACPCTTSCATPWADRSACRTPRPIPSSSRTPWRTTPRPQPARWPVSPRRSA
jgi:alcohol dehydrogenase class IV